MLNTKWSWGAKWRNDDKNNNMKKVKKLKSSTLIETLVASVIIMIVFAIFSGIWISLMQSHNKRISIDDKQLINETLYNYKSSRYSLPHEIEYDNKTVIVDEISNTNLTSTIEIILNNEDGELITKKKFIINEYN